MFLKVYKLRAENGRVSTYDVLMFNGPCAARGEKDRVMRHGVVWHESFIGPLCWVSPS